MGRRLWSMAACAVVLAGCGDNSSPALPAMNPTSQTSATVSTVAAPATVMSAAQLADREADALAFADRFDASFSDADAVFAGFTDDMVIYDPVNGDTFKGKAASVAAWAGFAAAWPEVEAHATRVYLSSDAAAFPTEVFNLVAMPDGGPFHEVRLYRFEAGLATVFDLWYRVQDLGNGCFAVDGCRVDPTGLANRYLAAWSAGGPEPITALYRRDARLVDSLLGIDAVGAAAVADVRDQRFGPGVELGCTVLDLYAQTAGPEPPTASQPDRGQVVAVAVVYRCTLTGGGDPIVMDHISALWLAARQADGSFDIDPEGLILREEVFHDIASLIAAGFAS